MSDTKTYNRRLTPVVSAASAYTAGDAVGGLLTFEDALDGNKKTGVVLSVTIQDNDSEDAALELVLFSQPFTATADNAAFDPTDADLANCLGKITITAGDYTAFSDNSIATARNVGLVVNSTDVKDAQKGNGNLYGQLITSGTPTYTAITDISVTLGVLQD